MLFEGFIMVYMLDMFVGILIFVVFCVGGEDVQLVVVDDMVDGLECDGDLDSQIVCLCKYCKEVGDFGMEIVSVLFVLVFIEVGKGLWVVYLKKFGEKVGGQFVDLIYQQVFKFVQWLFIGEECDQVQVVFNE